MSKIGSRASAFFTILWLYACALITAALFYILFEDHPALLRVFLADVVATAFVWFLSTNMKNSSIYDPYWSVAPVILASWWVISAESVTLTGILLLVAIVVWGARLTANWARRWRGFAHQDWRYTMYKEKMPGLWPVVNLFGIHLMPTVLVFLAMIPVYEAVNFTRPGALTYAGFALCAFAVGLEHIADRQMDAYRLRARPKGPYIAEGVWLWCRHPNYLGEILFWWGIWGMQMGVVPVWRTIIGPVCITLLFVFISIPMMEKHVLESRPEYAEYIKNVPMLLPLRLSRFVPAHTGNGAKPRT